jgi:hypothetical protein
MLPRSARLLALLLIVAPPLLNASPVASDRRLLIVATPALDDPSYRAQAAALIAAWDGLIERDFRILTETGAKAFSVRLLGKDGGEKLRSNQPVSTESLFALVDAMPMRRQEMRERAGPSP